MSQNIPAEILAAQDDPFTACNKAITDALLMNHRIAAWVRSGSRISTVPREGFSSGNTQPMDPAGDPELLVTQAGFMFLLDGRNSKTVDAQQTYTLQVATAVLDVVPLNLMKWEMLKALFRACEGEHPLGLPFVRRVLPQQGQEGTDPEAARGLHGWAGVMNVVIDFYFSRSLLA